MDPIIDFLGYNIVLEYDKKLLVNSCYSFSNNYSGILRCNSV